MSDGRLFGGAGRGVGRAPAGTSGAGSGQFSGLRKAAVDSAGAGHLVDQNNFRGQKFFTMIK